MMMLGLIQRNRSITMSYIMMMLVHQLCHENTIRSQDTRAYLFRGHARRGQQLSIKLMSVHVFSNSGDSYMVPVLTMNFQSSARLYGGPTRLYDPYVADVHDMPPGMQ